MDLDTQIEADWDKAIRENRKRNAKEWVVGGTLGVSLFAVISSATLMACYFVDNYNNNPTFSGAVKTVAGFYKALFSPFT
jgi:hypothetical protein